MTTSVLNIVRCALLLAVLTLGACASSPVVHSSGGAPMKIELLGFPSCPNTPAMRENLRAALEGAGAGLGSTFADVNQESLPESDPRRGWPTPTILVDGHDLFGMPAPTTPAMGCRIYPNGVPGAAEIRTALNGTRTGK